MKSSYKYFRELSANELYNIYYLRCLVFVVEQNCAYQEVDENDTKARHLMFLEDEQLIAYARILPPDEHIAYTRIGRVVVHPDFRKKKYGQILMKTAIENCLESFPGATIKISAQSHLKNFYQNLGFNAIGEEYLEDNIPHIAMKLQYTSNHIS